MDQQPSIKEIELRRHISISYNGRQTSNPSRQQAVTFLVSVHVNQRAKSSFYSCHFTFNTPTKDLHYRKGTDTNFYSSYNRLEYNAATKHAVFSVKIIITAHAVTHNTKVPPSLSVSHSIPFN